MKVELKDLHDGPLDVKIDCSPEEIELDEPDFRFPDRVQGLVNFKLVGKRVMAKGPIHTRIIGQCVRCLADVELPLASNVDAVYENDEELLKPERKAFGSDEQIITYYDGESIHPEPELRETLMLELPMRPLCKEDCKGLCPSCGADLNETTCDCAENLRSANAWKATLKNIKLE